MISKKKISFIFMKNVKLFGKKTVYIGKGVLKRQIFECRILVAQVLRARILKARILKADILMA
jgi:hypothetical protein